MALDKTWKPNLKTRLLLFLVVQSSVAFLPTSKLPLSTKIDISRHAAHSSAATAEPLPSLKFAYSASAVASSTAWLACASTALGHHPTLALPSLHVKLTILQAVTPLPLLVGSFVALTSAAEGGWEKLASGTVRRTNLALAATSLWLAAAVGFAPLFTTTVERAAINSGTALPHMLKSACITYPTWLRYPAMAAHLGTALLCLSALTISSSDDKSSEIPSAQVPFAWKAVTIAFACWAGVAALAPFPLATLPTMMGRRLSRAFGAFSLLYAATAFTIGKHDHNISDEGGVVASLKFGMALAAAAHFVANALKVTLEWPVLFDYYPAAFSQPIPAIVAFGSFGLALWASR